MPNEHPLIAIVDDDEAVREATKGLIRSMGLAAVAFSCGEDFLRSPNVDRTACLVTDINMPGMSGLDLHERLVASSKDIPIILITAYPTESTRNRALNAGIKSYLVKPFSEVDLLNCLRCALDRRQDDANAG